MELLTAPNSSAPALSPRSTSVGRVAAVATIIGVFIVATSLLRHDGDIAGLIKFGAGDTVAERTAHVEDVLGRDVATVDLLGHDGSMFFLQALEILNISLGHHPHDHQVLRYIHWVQYCRLLLLLLRLLLVFKEDRAKQPAKTLGSAEISTK